MIASRPAADGDTVAEGRPPAPYGGGRQRKRAPRRRAFRRLASSDEIAYVVAIADPLAIARRGQSNIPIFVRKRFGVQFVPHQPPMRKQPVHQSDELIRMVSFKEVGHLMDDDVVQALGRLFDQLQIEPYAPRFDVTGAPLGFHPLDAPSWSGDLHRGGPLLDERRRTAA